MALITVARAALPLPLPPQSELHKIAALNPEFKCVLRIRADDPDARVPLGLKYGANVEEAPKLLATAKALGLAVVGVSFHVGSACKNLATFSGAIESARMVRAGLVCQAISEQHCSQCRPRVGSSKAMQGR